jgi:hypothetical protein
MQEVKYLVNCKQRGMFSRTWRTVKQHLCYNYGDMITSVALYGYKPSDLFEHSDGTMSSQRRNRAVVIIPIAPNCK